MELRVAEAGGRNGILGRATVAGAIALALLAAAPADAARFGVPTNLHAAGQVCTAVGTPVGCTAVSADPPGWLVLERLNSGSANGDVVKQVRFFVEVTGTTLDIRVFDAGLSGARDLGNAATFQYRLLNPTGTLRGVAHDRGRHRGAHRGPPRPVRLPGREHDRRLPRAERRGQRDEPASTARRAGTCCGPRTEASYIFEVTVQVERERRGPERVRGGVPGLGREPLQRVHGRQRRQHGHPAVRLGHLDDHGRGGGRPPHRERLRLHRLLPLR